MLEKAILVFFPFLFAASRPLAEWKGKISTLISFYFIWLFQKIVVLLP